MTLHDTSFAFVNIETTGSSAVYDRVIEIAVIVMEGNQVTRKWSTLVLEKDNPSGEPANAASISIPVQL